MSNLQQKVLYMFYFVWCSPGLFSSRIASTISKQFKMFIINVCGDWQKDMR